MKKTRILALVIAVLSLVTLLFLVSCKGDSGNKNGNCAETGEHKWGKWTSNGDATCTQDGTRTRKCPVCKAEEKEVDPDTATGHYFLADDYELNGDATCTEDGTETALCYLCNTEKDTRVAVDSALGHRYGNNPVAEESHNGFNVFVCLREGCGHKETFDNGTIDEDFEFVGDAIEDNSKRYFNFDTSKYASIKDYTEGEGKYLMLERTNDRIVGNTAFGIFLTPDYDLYKSKDYVVSYDILITENTRDLVLLSGKKSYTEQVFATYDSENKAIVVNGEKVADVTVGEWFNLAFILDDVNAELDVYVKNQLVVSKAIYDKKDTYYLAADIEYLAISMVAEPIVASEFGLDNIKTYVGKTVTNPGEPLVRENITSTVPMPTNIMGDITMDWIEQFKEGMKATIGGNYTDDKFNTSFGYSKVDGKDVMVWQNFKTGIPYFNINKLAGVETHTLRDEDTDTNYDFTNGKTYEVYDLTKFDSITINFYCDATSEELAAMGREGYQMLIAFYTPNAWRSDKNAYWGTYTQTYYTFTAEDVLNGEDGWQTVTIPLSKFNQNHLKNVTHFTITGKGWGSDGVGIGSKENNDNNAVDGTVIKISSITLDTNTAVTHKKHVEGCEHNYVGTKAIAATCTTAGFNVKVCECGGEEVDTTSFTKPIGHNYVTIQDTPATCTENGYYSSKCLNCNDKIRTDRVATGHTESTAEGYAPTVIDATCYSTGITVRTCGACGVTYETDPTEMIEHTWGEGVVTEPNCFVDGVTTYTCIHNGENGCDGVKTEAIPALGHEADPEQNGEPVAATCDKGGFIPSKCVRCSADMEIPTEEKKLGHDWVYVEDSDKNVAATCFADGAAFYACSRCDKTKIETISDRPAHTVDMLNGTVVTAPTCTAKGVGAYKCTVEGCDYTEAYEIDMIDHVESTEEGYVPVVTAPVCGVDGYTTRKCSVCAQEYKTDIVEAEEHDDGGEEHRIQVGDCELDGWERYTCVKCGVEVTVEGSFVPNKGGHKYETVIDEEEKTLKKICSVCGKKIDATVEKLPTYAELLAAVKTDLYADMVITEAVGTESTGSKNYGTANAYFQYCIKSGAALKITIGDNGGVDGIGKYVKWEKTGADTGSDKHHYVNAFTRDDIPMGGKLVFEVAVRLGEPGADGKYIGSDFQIIDRSTKANSAGGNAFVSFATFTADGKMTFKGSTYAVTFSKDKFTKVALAIDVNNNKMSIYVDGVLVNNTASFLDEKTAEGFDMTKLQFDEMRMFQYSGANSTSWIDIADMALYGAEMPYAVTGVDYCTIMGVEHEEGEPTVIAPTCTENGYTLHTCKNCGYQWNSDVTAATGHTESTAEGYAPVVVAPTCFSKGYTERICSVCEVKYNTDETEMIAHTMGETATETVPATCLEAGYEIYTCTVPGCGHTEKTVLPVLGHSEDSETVKVVEPTCIDDGYTIKKCPVCNTNFKTDETEAIGHVYGEFVTIAEPNCTDKGKQTKKCENCIWEVSEDIPALGHKWGEPVADHELTFPATCYADGSNFYVCSVCSVERTEVVTTRPAHTWGEEIETVAPTCNTVGKAEKTCTVEGCGAVSDRVVPKLIHILDKVGEVTKDPTCTETGIRTYKCTRDNCDHSVDEEIPALGHTLVIDPENNTYDCTTDGVEAFKCTVCGYTESSFKAATGHSFTGTPWIEDYQLPTCYADGIRTRKCANCDALMHEEGTEAEKLTCVVKTTVEHNMVAGEVTAPTTESEGYTTYKCTNEGCTHTEKRDIVPAISTGTQGFTFEEIAGGYYITAYTGTDKEIVIPATYNGKPVIGIDPAVFQYDACEITGVTFESDNVFKAEDYGMFEGCNLDYVVVKAGVTVTAGCFDGAVIGTIYLEDGASVEDIDWEMYEVGKVVDGPKE